MLAHVRCGLIWKSFSSPFLFAHASTFYTHIIVSRKPSVIIVVGVQGTILSGVSSCRLITLPLGYNFLRQMFSPDNLSILLQMAMLYQVKRYVDSTIFSIPSSRTGSCQLTINAIRNIGDGEKSVNEAQLHAIYRYNVCGRGNKENHKLCSLDWPCSLVPLISLSTKPLRFFKDGPLMSHYIATNRRPKGIKGSQQDSSTAEM